MKKLEIAVKNQTKKAPPKRKRFLIRKCNIGTASIVVKIDADRLDMIRLNH